MVLEIIIWHMGLDRQAEKSPCLNASVPMLQVVAKIHYHSPEGYRCTDARVIPCFLALSQDLSTLLAVQLCWYLWVLEKTRVEEDRMDFHRETGNMGCCVGGDPERSLHHRRDHNCRHQAYSCVAAVAVGVEGN